MKKRLQQQPETFKQRCSCANFAKGSVWIYGIGTRQLYTTEDIIALPDGVRAGLIDGDILVLEIVSPASRRMDYVRKLNKYAEAGVREYWIVDPDKENIIVYDLTNDEIYSYTFEDTVPVRIYSDFSIDFRELNFHR